MNREVLACSVGARGALFYKVFAGFVFLSGSVKNRHFLRKWCSKWCSETQDKMQYEKGGLRIDLRIKLGTNLELNCNELQLRSNLLQLSFPF